MTQIINVAMGAMDAMGHCSIYGALLQTSVDGPGFADGRMSMDSIRSLEHSKPKKVDIDLAFKKTKSEFGAGPQVTST